MRGGQSKISHRECRLEQGTVRVRDGQDEECSNFMLAGELCWVQHNSVSDTCHAGIVWNPS